MFSFKCFIAINISGVTHFFETLFEQQVDRGYVALSCSLERNPQKLPTMFMIHGGTERVQGRVAIYSPRPNIPAPGDDL